MPSYLHQLCKAIGLLDGQIEQEERLLQAARWALADEKFTFQPYKPIALQPVLATLKGKTTDAYIPALPLTLEPKKLLLEVPPTAEELKAQLDTLKESLKQANLEIQLLSTLEIHASTLAVSEKYNDLSLYDFCKMTAGIACCLERSSKIRLVGGSISGIQTYLYDIVSKNAAKLLKGRSFYLQLLADSLLEELLNKLLEKDGFKLSPCNVIYASGGGFFVLVPDVPGIEQGFKDFSETIAGQIYARHGTSLFAELAMTKAFDMTSKPVNKSWEELYKELDALKYQRLKGNNKLRKHFFKKFIEEGGMRKRDCITNEEIKERDLNKAVLLNKEDPNSLVLPFTKKQINLGRNLSTATYWVTSAIKDKNYKYFIDPFKKFHYLVDNLNEIVEADTIRVFNKPDTLTLQPFTFYGGNNFPTFTKEDIEKLTKNEEGHKPGDIKPFDFLVGNDPLKRLAILRMDVDRLGAIFSEGIACIPEKRYTVNFTRYAAVSRNLDYFFKGYLNTLQKDYQNTIIIYSGGDDLFIAGKWNEVLALAQDIHQAFKAWTCGNLTLSGGVVLLPAKFPVMQGARLADIAEKKAKKHQVELTDGIVKKNALCLFDVPLHWEKEFKVVKELYDKILAFLLSKELNKSFLSKINSHATAEQLYEQLKKDNKPATPKWRWVMAYDMTRYRNALKDEAKEAKKFIDRIAQDTFLNSYDGKKLESKYTFLTLLHIAVRWVELRYRIEKPEEFAD